MNTKIATSGLGWSRWVLLLVLSLAWGAVQSARAQQPVISEFMASSDGSLLDSDGDASDWIEIFNPSQTALSLAGWTLTDDPRLPAQWRFPSVTLPARGFVVVFASGKNRTDPSKELHTSFSLSRNGEYLALVSPDGKSMPSEFAPAFPLQFTGGSFGVGMSVESVSLVGAGAPAKLWVPPTTDLGDDWTSVDFNDQAWKPVTLGIGYNRTAGGGTELPEPLPAPVDVSRPGDPITATSLNSPANEGVENAIDNNPATKYLNFDKLNAGFTVVPTAGASVVTGLVLTSANDAVERDPTSFVLSGSNDGLSFVEVARGAIPAFSGRFASQTISFDNSRAWRRYRLLFPTVRSAGSAVAMQIAEVGFLGTVGDSAGNFAGFIKTDIESSMYDRSAAALVRVPFEHSGSVTNAQLFLHVRYEDGFIAFLNGVTIARANVPSPASLSSTAVTNRLQRMASVVERFDISGQASMLRSGRNVLTILGLNSQKDSRDFLLDVQLELVRVGLGQTGYLARATPGGANEAAVGGLVESVEVFPGRGFYDEPVLVHATCSTPGATIRYTTDGSAPSPTNGAIYSGSIRVERTTPLRVAAFREGWRPSTIVTHTYLFLGDIAQQTTAGAVNTGFPARWKSVAADYGLDPRVAGPGGVDRYGGKYVQSLKSDLASLPSISLVMPVADLFGDTGIYSNPESRGGAWERATSVEWLQPGRGDGFQENAGVRIQGGAFRRFDLSLKKSFRIVFRERYGASELKYPLFGPEATDRFDNVVLRANSNDAWPYGGGSAVYVRDAFAMETARAMGIPASHSRFAHLYINGLYWGLYNPVERPDAAFSAAYIGGEAADWDSINQDSAPDGNYDAWNRLMSRLNQGVPDTAAYQRLQGNNPDGTRNPAYEDLLNVGNMIDYLLVNFYVGNTDWPGRNWWAGRDRTGGDGFTFRPWDTETALGLSAVDVNVTGAGSAVARPFAVLRSNPDFRMDFADHVFRHFSLGGALYVNPTNTVWDPAHPENNQPAARFAAFAEGVRASIVGESARWGDQLRGTPFTRDEHWQKERDRLLKDYFPRRSALVLGQLRQAGLYPRTDPPVLNQKGGVVAPGFTLLMTTTTGVIYYTLDGGDPRTAANRIRYGDGVVLKDLTTVRARVLNGAEWSALSEATFSVGTPRLAVSEIHYHPAAPTLAERAAGFGSAEDFEFIELVNAGATTCDLRGVRFTMGVAFSFAGSKWDRLASGGVVLIVKNRAAFEARYGLGLPVAGEYSGKLDNAGERLVVVDGSGAAMLDFAYGTTGSWPASADGGGFSLEAVEPGLLSGVGSSWRASSVAGGTPGDPNFLTPFRLENVAVKGSALSLRFRPRIGEGYTVFARESLTTGEWRVLQRGPAQARSDPIEVTVGLSTTSAARYVRVSIP